MYTVYPGDLPYQASDSPKGYLFATMSDHNHQQWSAAWNAGNASGQATHETWSWSSNDTIQQQQQPPPLPPPQMIQQQSNTLLIDHAALHRQSLESATQLHQQALQSAQSFHQQAMDMHTSMASSMHSMMQASMSSMTHGMGDSYQSWSTPPQIQQAQTPSPGLVQHNVYNHYHLPPAQSPLPHLSPAQQQEMLPSAPSPAPPAPVAQEPLRITGVADDGSQQRLDAMQRDQDAKNRAMQRRYEQDQAAAKERFRLIEEAQSRDRVASEAKDREIKKLREQHAAAERGRTELERQRREDAERFAMQMAEMAKANAARPKTPPAFDMQALRKVIQEVQSRQLSPADLERVVQSTMDKQLNGMATKADVSAGTQHMQQALNRVPAGASQEQVSQVVNQELMNMIKGLTAARQSAQQQRIEASRDQRSTQMKRQEVPKATFEVEELSDDEPVPASMNTRAQGSFPLPAAPSIPLANRAASGTTPQHAPVQPTGATRQSGTPHMPHQQTLRSSAQAPSQPQHALARAAQSSSPMPRGTHQPSATTPGTGNAIAREDSPARISMTTKPEPDGAFMRQAHSMTASVTTPAQSRVAPSGAAPSSSGSPLPQRQIAAPASAQAAGTALARIAPSSVQLSQRPSTAVSTRSPSQTPAAPAPRRITAAPAVAVANSNAMVRLVPAISYTQHQPVQSSALVRPPPVPQAASALQPQAMSPQQQLGQAPPMRQLPPHGSNPDTVYDQQIARRN